MIHACHTQYIPLLIHSSFPPCFVAVKNFALIPQHTSPSSAVKEVDALYDVVADVRNHWNTNVNTLFKSSKTNTHKRKMESRRYI